MMSDVKICICDHPESWHEKGDGKTLICWGAYCRCKILQPTYLTFDEEKWVNENGLKMVQR